MTWQAKHLQFVSGVNPVAYWTSTFLFGARFGCVKRSPFSLVRARALVSRGFEVHAMDHVGHGQSEGDRAHVERFSHYARDFLHFVKRVQAAQPRQLPCFLLGSALWHLPPFIQLTVAFFVGRHSMGGAIAIQVMRASAGDGPEGKSGAAAAAAEGKSESKSAAAADKAAASLREAGAGLWPWRGCVLSGPVVIPDPDAASPFMRKVAAVFGRLLPKLQAQKLEAG